VDGRPFRIAGVAREGFFGVEPGKFVDVWLPATSFDPGALTNPNFDWSRIVGRLKPAQPANNCNPACRSHFITIARR